MSDLSANPDLTPKFPEITPEFVLIPAGSFQMGDATDADQNAPVHSVYVDAFFFGKYLVTKSLWDQCRNWAIHHGYPDLPEGEATGPSHPVQMISWFEMAKWINALSEQHHLTPAYYTNESHSTVYRTGDIDLRIDDVNWRANGYRFPTEAEWEKAARGHSSHLRFSFGDSISHTQANYRSEPNCPYDLSPTHGHHPEHDAPLATGTSPVGSFPPNDFGIFDINGNAWEWTFDRYEALTSQPASNPRGNSPRTSRVLRGGSWYSVAYYCRTAFRGFDYPSVSNIHMGFRLSRSFNPPPDAHPAPLNP
jgi:formylglycine-generating enzyme required for sulfatase activity